MGGTVSLINNEDFWHGAAMGAFSRAFNDEMHRQSRWAQIKENIDETMEIYKNEPVIKEIDRIYNNVDIVLSSAADSGATGIYGETLQGASMIFSLSKYPVEIVALTSYGVYNDFVHPYIPPHHNYGGGGASRSW